MHLRLPINPRKIVLVLGCIALVLSAISLFTEYLLINVFANSGEATPTILDLFSVNTEKSIPTWFATALLLGAAGTLALIASAKWSRHDTFRWHWLGLAIVFLYLSIDEGASIHEYFSDFFVDLLQTSGYLYFAWQIVAVPLVTLFGLIYVPFLFRLPPKARYGFVLAAVFYLGGALFIEALSASHLYQTTVIDFTYLAIATIEETCEMLGAIIFIAVLWDYINREGYHFTLMGSDVASGHLEQSNPTSAAKPVTQQESSQWRWLQDFIMQSAVAPYWVVLFGGINLILIQWVLVRELTTMLRGTELVILLVAVSYFLGLSVGYFAAGRIKASRLKSIGAIILFMHLSLPIWFRLLVTGLDKINAFGVAYLLLPAVVPFIISAFYSMFLPLYVDSGEGKLSKLYAVEVLGSALGILGVFIFARVDIVFLFITYALVLLAILALLGISRIRLLRLTLIAIGWLWFFPALNNWSNTLWFQQLQDLPDGSRTLLTTYSPYQKVDVLEDPSGNRYLFLDSMEHFGSPSGIWLNIIMGRIPAALIEPENAVAFGAGSMELELMISNYADHVTSVEIDPVVVDASLNLFTEYNHMDRLANRTVLIDDARHFIANTDKKYDLIVSALPAAFTLQTGALYAVPFVQDVHAHLGNGGVFVMNLTGPFTLNHLVARRIVASLLTDFEDVMIVTSNTVGLSFAYASDSLPFSSEDVRAMLESNGEMDYAIFDTVAAHAIVGDAQPITFDSLDFVMTASIDRIRSLVTSNND